jgi:hypothetical protein
VRLSTVFDFCIVGPSAIGSVKGSPSSMTSRDMLGIDLIFGFKWHDIPAPPASIPKRISTVSADVGNPAVTYVTRAG